MFYKVRHWLWLAIVMQHLDVLVSINAKDFGFQKFMVSERFPVFLDELSLDSADLSSYAGLRESTQKSHLFLSFSEVSPVYRLRMHMERFHLPFSSMKSIRSPRHRGERGVSVFLHSVFSARVGSSASLIR